MVTIGDWGGVKTYGFRRKLSKFSREAFLFFYKVDNNTPLRALSPTLFYFLKVVSGEFACFRGVGKTYGFRRKLS
jgi:hypothetical protein